MKHVGVLYNPLRMLIVRIVHSAIADGQLRKIAYGRYHRLRPVGVRARKIAA